MIAYDLGDLGDIWRSQCRRRNPFVGCLSLNSRQSSSLPSNAGCMTRGAGPLEISTANCTTDPGLKFFCLPESLNPINSSECKLCFKFKFRFKLISFGLVVSMAKGLASYCKAETTFTFHFTILTLTNAFLGIGNREMKSESGFSFAIASQPFQNTWGTPRHRLPDSP